MTVGEAQLVIPAIEGCFDGDWLCCGRCGRKLALGIAAIAIGARLPCRGCRRWVRVPMREATRNRRRVGVES